MAIHFSCPEYEPLLNNKREKVKVDLKHEVECPGHDDRIVEGDHGGDAEEAIAKATKARDKTREDLLRTKNIYF